MVALWTRVIQWIIVVCMITIVELPEFIKQAGKIFSEPLRESLVNYLAAHPKAGVVMEGTSGIRKFRWKREGTGKSGGARVIYYYYNDKYPLFIITVFKKGKKPTSAKKNETNLPNWLVF